MTVNQLLQLAVERHRAGRRAEAASFYQQILAMQPEHADAWNMLGVLHVQEGKFQAAIDFLQRAVAINAGVAEYYNNLSVALRESGRVDEAITCCRQALHIRETFADGHLNLALALLKKGTLEEATHAFRRARQLSPNHPDVLLNLGLTLRSLGRLDEAADAVADFVRVRPDLPEAHNTLGVVLSELGRHDEAISAYRRALALKPDHAKALNNLGNALLAAGQTSEAATAYRRSIELEPGNATAHHSLGVILTNLGDIGQGIESLTRADQLRPRFPETRRYLAIGHREQAKMWIEQRRLHEASAALLKANELDPTEVEAWYQLGICRRAQGMFDEAIAAYSRAIELLPDCAEAYANRATILSELGRVEESMAGFARALELKPTEPVIHSNSLFPLHLRADFDAVSIYQAHRQWDQQHAAALCHTMAPISRAREREPGRRIRIGYVSPDFRGHPVGRFLLPLLERHDRARFEIFCYTDVVAPDDLTERLRGHADVWRDIRGIADEEVAQRIRDDEIDVLVDLAGHTARHRLLVFARKPAAVQATWLGYPDTTGMRAIDYRITDSIADPPGMTESFHTETLVRLPDAFLCYKPDDVRIKTSPLPALARGHVTFGSFNTFAKVNPLLVSWWAQILLRVPGAKMLIKCEALAADSARKDLLVRFAVHGIGPERLDLRKAVLSHVEHLRLYDEVDVALDTFPYHGTTTTCEALWMGVPVVSPMGKLHLSRVGASILCNAGLKEWLADSPEQYVSIAANLAADVKRLAETRAALRGRMERSPLMDAEKFARNMEAAYEKMRATPGGAC